VARGWLDFLGLIKPKHIKQPYESELDAFVGYMRVQRNLSPLTIHTRRGAAAQILRWIHSRGIPLKDLEPQAIDRLLVYKARHNDLTRRSIQTYAAHLRSFLRYAEERGWCAEGVAAALEIPRVYQGEDLPSGPPWESIARVLAPTPGSQSGQIRDRAIILLFALYGLRVSELRRLTLDDIDWEHALLRVHRSKQSPHVQSYPLADAAKHALADYLKKVRTKSLRREVFLQLRTPYQPISSSALWQVVSRRLRPLGLPLKHHGPHSLRHACATRLLERGVSMKEIGDFLGHRHVASTSVYAKVDIEGLRRVANFDLGRFI